MFCIAGLGNPGIQYQETRHNAGFLVVDQFGKQTGVAIQKKGFQGLYGKGRVDDKEFFLLKPQTFMNLSGHAVFSLVSYFKVPIHQLLIIYDDLDLPLGKIRFRLSGSAGGHKGLTSIIEMLGTNQIPRLRIGIGKPQNEQSVPDYVLTTFAAEERPVFMESIERAASAAKFFVTEGPQYVMNHFN